ILGLFAASAVCFAILIPYELRRAEPLLELRFFRSAPFSGASVIAVLAFASLGGFLFLNTLYLQDVRGLSPLNAGLYLLPMSGMPSSQAGVASAIASTSRQVGMTLGVAVIGAIAGGAISSSVGRDFAAATHPAWWVIAGFGAAILVLGLLTTTRWADQTAKRTAQHLSESEM